MLMRLVTLLAAAVLLTAAPANAAPPPPPPTGPGQAVPLPPSTPESDQVVVKVMCPVAATWQTRVIKVGMGPNSDHTFTTGGARFCRSKMALEKCLKVNPTPAQKCRLLVPEVARPGGCTPLPPTTDEISNAQELGPLELGSTKIKVQRQILRCDRQYKLTSCDYWNAGAQLKLVMNNGLLGQDTGYSGTITGCDVDKAAEQAFQARWNSAASYLNGMMTLKHGIWKNRCAGNAVCLAKVRDFHIAALSEGIEKLTYPFDANGPETMKYLAKKYDPLVAAL